MRDAAYRLAGAVGCLFAYAYVPVGAVGRAVLAAAVLYLGVVALCLLDPEVEAT